MQGEVPGFTPTQGVNLENLSTVPGHLEVLYSATLQELETEAQAQELASFLNDHQAVFAKHDDDLGRTGVVQHQIDTGDHPPIKQ